MVLAQENLSAPLADKNRVWWLLPDQLGSTRDVVNNQGEIVAHFQYDAYGLLLDGRENVTRYQFTGREHDSNTDYNYHRARWYDPASGKWLSEDPIGLAGGDYNLSRYVNNGPTNSTDPSGLAKRKIRIGGLDAWLDDDTLEFVFKNDRRVKIRNGKFIGSTVTLDDLEKIGSVNSEKLKKLREIEKKAGKELSVCYDTIGQPDFSAFHEHEPIVIRNPSGSRYGERAWKQLQERDEIAFKELLKMKDNLRWHHLPDGKLVLIDRDVHEVFGHTGYMAATRAANLKAFVGAAVIASVPGLAEAMEGDFNGAAREAVIDQTPLSWGQYLSSYFEWLYDAGYQDCYEHDEKVFK